MEGGSEGSDGGHSGSAPSELLAEFLSAMMRRQWPEALKYCRLILHYEPHNAAARGFYPLLRTRARRSGKVPEGSCSSGGASSSSSRSSEEEGEWESERASSPERSGSSSPGGACTDSSGCSGAGGGSSASDESPSALLDDNGNCTDPTAATRLCHSSAQQQPPVDNAPPCAPAAAGWAPLQRLRAHFSARDH